MHVTILSFSIVYWLYSFVLSLQSFGVLFAHHCNTVTIYNLFHTEFQKSVEKFISFSSISGRLHRCAVVVIPHFYLCGIISTAYKKKCSKKQLIQKKAPRKKLLHYIFLSWRKNININKRRPTTIVFAEQQLLKPYEGNFITTAWKKYIQRL